MQAARTVVDWGHGTVSTLCDHPERGETYLVLGHGAGGNMHTPDLARFAQALAALGIGAVRFNFPYAEAHRKVPDRQATLEACYRAVADQVAPRVKRLFLGGRSMGGRIASHIVAAGHPTAGLVFLSYPLHPPGRPDRIRDAHLPRIVVPMLFIQGTNDSFARPDLLAATLSGLPRATLHSVEGGDHGLKVRGQKPEAVTQDLARVAAAWISANE